MDSFLGDQCANATTITAPLYGSMGVVSALAFSALGAAIGTGMSCVGAADVATIKPEMMYRALIPVVMSGVQAIYGVVVAVIICGQLTDLTYTARQGYFHLAAGLTVGIAALGSGIAIGLVAMTGNRAICQQPRYYVPMVLALIFAEVLGLYGLIVALLLTSK